MKQDPVTLVSQIVEQNISAMTSNKILKVVWYNRDLFRELEHYYEEVKGDDDSIRSLYAGLFKKWKAEGAIREDIDEGLLSAFFDSLAYIAKFIMKGLTDFKK